MTIGITACMLFNFCRFGCYVQRDGFPLDKPSNFADTVDRKIFMYPGHTITLSHHLVLVNLLPVELSYIIKGIALRERIKSGKSIPLHNVCTNVNILSPH